jgi:hypothetical protein
MPGMSFQTTGVVMSVREVAKSGGSVRESNFGRDDQTLSLGWVASLSFGLFTLYMFAHILHNIVY